MPGGQVLTAAACHLKDKLYWCIEDLMTAAKKAGAQIHLGTELSAKEIADSDPWGVVVATGGEPVRPRSIAGLDGKNVFTAPQIIHRDFFRCLFLKIYSKTCLHSSLFKLL